MTVQIDRTNLARWFARTVNQSSIKQPLSKFSHRSYSNQSGKSFRSNKPSRSSNDRSSGRSEKQSNNYPTNGKSNERPATQSIKQPFIPSTTSLPFAHVSHQDEVDDVSPESLMATLVSIDRLSNRINQSINQSLIQLQNPLVQSKSLSTEELRVLRRKRATVMNSLAVLLDSAAYAHRAHADRHLKPRAPPSQMTEQLRALESVWHSVLQHGHPTPKQFTQLVQAYGREARRTKIRDLFDRWAADKEAVKEESLNESEKLARQHDRQLRRDTLEAQLNDPNAMNDDIVPVKLQLAIMDRADRWREGRLARERENPVPSRDLYPLMKLDTTAYNTIISSYLASLSYQELKPDSPVLAFPLSLLPKFKPDAATYTVLMNLYCGMGDTKRVMQLFQEWRDKEKEEAMERGGRRLPQEQRQKKKEQRAYVYAIALRSLADSPDLADAEAMWKDLHVLEEDKKLELTRPVYHSMLHVYAKHNQHEKIREVAVEMRRRSLEMNDDSVCTVIKSLCEAGHTEDAIMMHQRIAHGTMGAARSSRKTYMSLFSHLAKRQVSQSALHDLFAAGMEDGSLRSPTAHRLKWTIDMRAMPLNMLPLSVAHHLQSMLAVYMQTIREKGQKAADSLIPERGLLIILGKNRAQQERERAAEFDRHARDFDAALDSDEVELFSKPSEKQKYNIIVDEFADEEEKESLEALDELRVQGSYVQRYVQHLLVQEWPSIVAQLTPDTDAKDTESAQSATVNVNGVDLSISASLNSTAPHSTATLRVSRPNLLFWLQCRSCIVGNDSSLYPPPAFTRAQALHWATIQEKSIELLKQQLSVDAVALDEKLIEYKRQERLQLRKSANALNGKLDPRDAVKLNGIPSEQEIEEAKNQPVYRSLPIKTRKAAPRTRKSSKDSSSVDSQSAKPTQLRTPIITSYLSNETLSFLQKQDNFAPHTKSKLAQLREANQSTDSTFRPSDRQTRDTRERPQRAQRARSPRRARY